MSLATRHLGRSEKEHPTTMTLSSDLYFSLSKKDSYRKDNFTQKQLTKERVAWSTETSSFFWEKNPEISSCWFVMSSQNTKENPCLQIPGRRSLSLSNVTQEMSTTCGTQTCLCLLFQSLAILLHSATQSQAHPAILVPARKDAVAIRRKHENLC